MNSTNSFDVTLKEQQHASVNTATSSINNHSNPILKENQKQNSANQFSSTNSERQDQLQNKQHQQRVINGIDVPELT